MKLTTALAVSVVWFSCTKKADQCDSSSDCTDPAYPFCDVNGQYAPSGGNKNVCTIIPPDCPADVCGCMPGATTCASDQLTTCNADGMSTSTSTCALGCSDAGLACKSFTPSNGLAPILAEASAEPDATIPSGSTIDTDTCVFTASNGAQLLVGSLVVQAQAPMICAFAAHNFTIADVTVTGSSALALVAANDLAINGIIDASANGGSAGPGAKPPGTVCDGGSVTEVRCAVGTAPAVPCSTGAGGGGNAIAGGSGGTDSLVPESDTFGSGTGSGGAPMTGFSPLVGGCSGGNSTSSAGTLTIAAGGGGGGAVQLVSGATLELVGIVHVGGGGGSSTSPDATGGGGGAGGDLVIEAPTLMLGTAGGFAANGGAGGGCGVAGTDATPDGNASSGGDDGACSGSDYSLAGGAGGTGALAPGDGGEDVRVPPTTTDRFGGGGGSVGRVRVATRDGTFVKMSSSLQSAALTTEMLVTQ